MPRYIEFVLYRAFAELKAEASRFYFGALWWFAEPILFMTVFYFMFAVGFRRGGEDFVAFLLCGLVAWKWFQSSVQRGATSIISNRRLLAQLYFPKYLLILISVVTNTIRFFLVLAVLLLFLGFSGYDPGWEWLYLPLVIGVELLLILAIVSVLAAVTPFMQDLLVVTNNVMLLLFVMSGIFFDISERPQEVQNLMYLNPVASIIDSYRDILLYGSPPNFGRLESISLFSMAVLVLGFSLLKRFDRTFAKLII